MLEPEPDPELPTAAQKRADARRALTLAIVSSAAVLTASVLIVLSGARF